uniref:Uncharacterized protein n=1 Tax=Panagrolaimus davidi TaxID=227884 RepID=A0A914QU74_9BILA
MASNQPIISINGITLTVKESLQQTSPVTFRLPENITLTPSTNVIGCSADQPNGTWSQWIIDKACSADCGSCGRLTRTRQCLSFNTKNGSGCPCRGEYKQMEPCNIGVCQFPQPSCCPPYNLIFIEGYFACGPQNEKIIQKFLQHVSNG